MTASISFCNLTVETREGAIIVNDFCLEVGEGEVVALIGESGAGKSTIGLCALGYLRAGCRIAGGEILLSEDDISALGRDSLRAIRGRRIGYAAQGAAVAFNPSIPIIDQLIEAALAHGLMRRPDAAARACDLGRRMALPNIEALVQRYPHQLSGGQLQRLMIVMALMCRPTVLVLDEPTTAIDVTTQLGLLVALRRIIEEERATCIYISHDLAVAAQMADRIVVLRGGRVVEVGEAATLIAAPRALYTRELVTAADPASQLADKVGRNSNTASHVLELHDVGARYGPVQVLSGVHLIVRSGECVAVIGESGSGKSTLARAVVGLLPNSTGDMRHNGVRLERAAAKRTGDQRRRVQLVLQHSDLALNPRIVVGDAVGRPLTLFFGTRGLDLERRVAQLLELVELPAAMAMRYPSQLSGGQRQRVNLARALAAEPDLLICDEVTSALDAIVGAKILQLLASVREKTGAACIFITHDISKAAAIADEVYVMRRGKIVERGAPKTLLTKPQHAYTQALLRSVPEMRVDWLAERMQAAALEDAVGGLFSPKRGE